MDILKRFLSYIKPYRMRLIEALLCMSMVGILTSALMYMIKPTMDGIFGGKEVFIPLVGMSFQPGIELLPILALIILSIAFLKGIFTYCEAYLLSYMGQRIVMDIRNQLYDHLQRLCLSFFLRQRTGNLISRLTNDVMLLQNAIRVVPRDTIRQGFTVFFLIFIIFYLNWIWALIALILFPFLVIPLSKFGERLRRVSLQGQEKMADIYSILQERISGAKLIKSFCMEEEEIKKLHVENRHFFNIIMRSMRIISMQSPIMEFIATIGIVGILIMGGYQVISGKTTPGTFFAFIGALSAMYKPIKGFATVNHEIQQALAASERIFWILDVQEFIVEKPDAEKLPPFKRDIKFDKVGFLYEEGDPILKDIQIRIERGEIVALVGPSGGGKTTLVNLLMRFFDPTSGRILIDGKDIRDVKVKSLRDQISIVTQEVILFNDSVRNNISYGVPGASLEQIVFASKAANAHDFIDSLPLKYDTLIGEHGVKLSGGQRQRLAIARAILRNPAILILDEATSSLDTESEKLVQDAIDRLMKDRTTIVIAHRLSTVKNVNRILVLDKGQIVEEGSHNELNKAGGLYSKLYNIQEISN